MASIKLEEYNTYEHGCRMIICYAYYYFCIITDDLVFYRNNIRILEKHTSSAKI